MELELNRRYSVGSLENNILTQKLHLMRMIQELGLQLPNLSDSTSNFEKKTSPQIPPNKNDSRTMMVTSKLGQCWHKIIGKF